LAFGMDSGVCASRTCKFDAFAGYLPDRVLEDFLNRYSVGLELPSGISRAIVGYREFYIAHIIHP